MTDGTEPEVKDVERVEIEPTTDEETIDPPEEPTSPESSPDENPDGTEPSEEIEKTTPPDAEPKKPVAAVVPVTQKVEVDGIKRLPDETDREYAQRLEITRLRGKLRGERVEEIVGKEKPPVLQKPTQRPESVEILKRYKPEQINELKEVFGVLAEDMGFVKKGEIESQTFIQKGEEELQSFLTAHPEYLPENDPQGLAWSRFKQEYGMYKPPSNPKDFKRLFEKVHRDIYGIQPKGDLGKINAAKEKIKVASHSGAPSSPGKTSDRPIQRTRSTGLRLDMLKGFSDEEKSELAGE